MKLITLIFTLYVLLSLSGCSSDPKFENWSAERFYSHAKEAMNNGDFTTAIKHYEMLEARYPLGKYAQQAQMDIIFAYYKSEDPESAILAAERFIKLYPRHPKLDYVYYLKGLIYFNFNRGSLDRFLPLDRSQREPSSARLAFYEFSALVTRFPNSRYRKNARQRMIYLRNLLAKHELEVARFYLKRGAYTAAANRAKTVIEVYQGTSAVPDALVILAKSYKIMEINDLSANVLKVLKLNYPDHKGIAEVENLVVK